MTKKEKKLKALKEKLVFYEGRLDRCLSDYIDGATESVSSSLNYQEVIMLNVAIEDLQEEIDELES